MNNVHEKEKESQTFLEKINRKKVKKIILIAALCLVAAAVLILKGASYAEKPEFCKTCHSMKYYYNTWVDSSHKEVTCFDCHIGYTPVEAVKPMPVTKKQYWALTFGDKTINISKYMSKVKEGVVVINRQVDRANKQIKFAKARLFDIGKMFSAVFAISNPDYISPLWSNCLKCHKDLISKTSKTDNTGHYQHLKQGMRCDQCHGTVIHGRAASMNRDSCIACHKEPFKKPASHKTAEFQVTHGKSYVTRRACTICHVKGGMEKLCMDCHGVQMPHRDDYTSIHVQSIRPAGIKTCMSCHKDNENKGTIKRNTTVTCSRCHGSAMPHKGNYKTILSHGSLVKSKGTSSCYACHNPVNCNNCHGGVPMPHPPKFVSQHMTATQKIGEDKCFNCHKSGSGKAVDCNSCHKNVAMPHPGGWYGKHFGEKQDCLICHSSKNPVNSKAPYANDKFCDKCHSIEKWHHDTAGDCRVCHVPEKCAECHGYNLW